MGSCSFRVRVDGARTCRWGREGESEWQWMFRTRDGACEFDDAIENHSRGSQAMTTVIPLNAATTLI